MLLMVKSNKRWQWATGAFGLYQSLNTKGPVTFWEDGVKDVIEGSANTAFAGMPANAPKLHLAINNPTLLVGGDLILLFGMQLFPSVYIE